MRSQSWLDRIFDDGSLRKYSGMIDTIWQKRRVCLPDPSSSVSEQDIWQNKPHHPTTRSRSVPMFSRDYNLNPDLAFRCRS